MDQNQPQYNPETQQNYSSMPEPMMPNLVEPKPKKALIITIAVIAILILATIGYYMMLSLKNPYSESAPGATTNTQGASAVSSDPETAKLQQQSNSDEVSDLDQDARATDLNNLDAGFSGGIDAELR